MAERVIWERTVDHERIRERAATFRKQFFIPAAVILLVVLVFAGWQNAIGVLLLLGLVGMLWGNAVRFKSLGDATNPTMVVDRGRLRVGRLEIVLEDVRRFTTIATSVQTSLLGRHSRIDVGKAVFRMNEPGGRREPDLIEIGWPNMGEEGIAEVRAALEPELAGKWVEPTELVTEDELPRRSRRPRML